MFPTQGSFGDSTAENLLFVGELKESELRGADNFDFRTEDIVTELFEETKTERGNTAVPTKRISERGEKRGN